MMNSILPLRVVDEENTLQFLTETNYQFSEHYKPLHSMFVLLGLPHWCTGSLWPRTNKPVEGTW